VFDFALHIRFLQKATEAFFEMGQASVAATVAWQSRLHDEMTSEGWQTGNAFSAWPVWFGDWTPAAATPSVWSGNQAAPWNVASSSFSPWQTWFEIWAPATASPIARRSTDPMQAWYAAVNAWQSLASPNAMAAMNAGMSGWPVAATQAMWSVTPWSFYQGPLTAMMLSYGVPYAVAAPTARASTSAMDAADAACTQWRLVFGNSDGKKGGSNLTARQMWPSFPL
jgi:hypothetical protein